MANDLNEVIRATCNFVDVGAPEEETFFSNDTRSAFQRGCRWKILQEIEETISHQLRACEASFIERGSSVRFLPSTDLVLESPPPPPTTISFRHLQRQQPASPPPTTRYDTDVQGHERKWSCLHLAGP